MTRPKDMTREDLMVELSGVMIERDRLRILSDDLLRELTEHRRFFLQISELSPGADADTIIAEAKVRLAFYRRVAALCPRAQTPGSMLDWIRTIKSKAAEYDKTVH